MTFMLEVQRLPAATRPTLRWFFLDFPPSTAKRKRSLSHAKLVSKHVVFVGRVPHVEVRCFSGFIPWGIASVRGKDGSNSRFP